MKKLFLIAIAAAFSFNAWATQPTPQVEALNADDIVVARLLSNNLLQVKLNNDCVLLGTPEGASDVFLRTGYYCKAQHSKDLERIKRFSLPDTVELKRFDLSESEIEN